MAREMRHGDYMKEGWEIVKANLGASILATVLILLIPIVNIQIMVNFFKAVRDYKTSKRPIDVGALFDFTNFGNNFVAALLVGLIASCCFLLYPLFFFALPILAENPRMNGIDAMKGAFAHGKANFGPLFLFMLLSIVVILVSELLCLLPVLVAFPTVLAAQWLAYEDQKEDVKTLAAQAGITI
jgi:uncharacterized membrane protein